MSAYPPPNEELPIFNASNFSSEVDPLTAGEADLRYLQLTGGSVSGPIVASSNGSAAAVAFSVGGAGTGVFAGAANQLNFATAGSSKLLITTASIQAALQLRLLSGSASAPGLAFTSDASNDTGIYLAGADNIGFSAGGTLRWNYNSSRILSTVPLQVPDGSVSSPSITFSSAADTGLFRHSSGALVATAGGVSSCVFGNPALSGAAGPSYGFVNSTGTGSSTDSSGRNYAVWVLGSLAVGGTATAIGGTITGNNALNEINVFSDARIKHKVAEFDDHEIDDFMKYQPVHFNLIGSKAVSTGFIAQEVEEVNPLFVRKISNYIPNVFKKLPIERVSGRRNTTHAIKLDRDYDIKDGSSLKLYSVNSDGEVVCEMIAEVVDMVGRRLYVSLVSSGDAGLRQEDADFDAADVFVYGELVSDFRTVNEMGVLIHGVAFTQKMYREQLAVNSLCELRQKALASRLRVLQCAVIALFAVIGIWAIC